MERKNNDYAGGKGSGDDPFANFKMSSTIGVHPAVGLLLRMMDKIQRIRTFTLDGGLAVSDESVDDACDDIVNYAILCKGLLKEMRESDRSKVPTPEEAIDRMSRSVLTEVTPGKPVPCAPNPAYKDAPVEEIRGVFKKGKFLVDTVMTETRSYRLLKKGERLKVGDEIKSHNSSAWGPCHLFVNDTPYFAGVSPDCPEGQSRRWSKGI